MATVCLRRIYRVGSIVVAQGRRGCATGIVLGDEDDEEDAELGVPSKFKAAEIASLLPKTVPDVLGVDYHKVLRDEVQQQSRLDVMLANGEQRCAEYYRAAEPLWKELKSKMKREAIHFRKLFVSEKVTRPMIRGLLLHLLKHSKYHLGFMASGHMIYNRLYDIEQMDYIIRLAFAGAISNHLGQDEALFNAFPAVQKPQAVYHALLAGYVIKRNRVKAQRVYQEMKDLEMYTDPFSLNQMLLLHSQPDLFQRIPMFLEEFKSMGGALDVHSYNLYLASGQARNVDEVLELLRADPNVSPDESTYFIAACLHLGAGNNEAATKCLLQIEEGIQSGLFKKRQATFNKLLRLYGDLRDKDGVESMWSILRSRPLKATDSYSYAIEAFGKLGEIEKAQEVFAKGDCLHRTKQVISLVAVYTSWGQMDLAKRLFNSVPRKNMKHRAIYYRLFISGYLRLHKEKEALGALRLGRLTLQNKCVSRIWYEAVVSIMDHFANKGDVEGVEECFQCCTDKSTNKKPYRDVQVYRVLLKAYLNARRPHKELLKLLTRIDKSGVPIDPETLQLMRDLRKRKVYGLGN